MTTFPTITCRPADAPNDLETEAVNRILREHNRRASPDFWAATDDGANAPCPLNILALDQSLQVVGGLFAETRLAWLKIAIMAVQEPLRRQGVGRAMLALAEAESLRRGCRHAYVDTMQHQAPGFYERCGYTIVGTLADWDSYGHAKFLLTKDL